MGGGVMSDHVDALITLWSKLYDERKQIEHKLDALAELITPELGAGERRGGVLVVAQRRFSARLAKETLSAEDFDRICEQKPSVAKAQRLLGDDVVELLREDGPRFLRRADDD